jgi:xanthine dehydrogenase accessory factor
VNKKDILLWTFIAESIKSNKPVALLQVVESIGSSPGRQGFRMAIDENGVMAGSIGGGIMEHKLVEYALSCLQKKDFEPFLKRQIHDKTAAQNQSGMICSGEQTVLFYFFKQDNLDKINQIIACLSENTEGVVSISNISFDFSFNNNKEKYLFIHDSESWIYKENLGEQNHLYILGGGHCALALSRQMSLMPDFYIHLYDNRDDLNTFKINTFAHEKAVVDFDKINEIIPSGDNIFVAIMTFGYRTDAEILRGLFGKNFAYIGMLGSATKIQKMFDDFEKEGFDKDYLEKIYAPIGLIPHTRTPEEIAVSIAAQIIQVKHLNK